MKKILFCMALAICFWPAVSTAGASVVVDATALENVQKYIQIKDAAQLDKILKQDQLDRQNTSVLLFSMITHQTPPALMTVAVQNGADAEDDFILPGKGTVNLLFVALQQYAKPNVMQFLLGQKANPNARMAGEEVPALTVLMVAAATTPYPEIIDMLLAAGADVNATYNERTAADYIDINPYLQNTEILTHLKKITQASGPIK